MIGLQTGYHCINGVADSPRKTSSGDWASTPIACNRSRSNRCGSSTSGACIISSVSRACNGTTRVRAASTASTIFGITARSRAVPVRKCNRYACDLPPSLLSIDQDATPSFSTSRDVISSTVLKRPDIISSSSKKRSYCFSILTNKLIRLIAAVCEEFASPLQVVTSVVACPL